MPDNRPAPRRGPVPSRPASGSAKVPPSSSKSDKAEHEILFQKYFKSVGPRTYAAQVKRAANENHYLVLTEGKRDEVTGEVRKTRLFVFSEDFVEFFRMLHETAQFIKANPVPEEVKKKRQRFWARQAEKAGGNAGPPRPAPGSTRSPGSAPGRHAGPPPTAARPRNGTPVSTKAPPGFLPPSRPAPKPSPRAGTGKAR